ncbi:NAD(P)/FAD-dependent oxidoreductase [Sphingoaurantiacus capsulatus]|uniref:NAD(P)/FAD-dependent oxidoreductase n=1 Tax=Sphingoaurantiacus capsulatus TaxID=1771310 RepID=A0ABV7X744_9SPHN
MTPEVAIIGAGIAGASVAYFLGDRARVTIIEGESHPGYHTTGRSAAFYAETYGGPVIQPLTTGSKDFFEAPPAGFADAALLTPRGGLHIANEASLGELDALAREFADTGVVIERLDGSTVAARWPQLRPEWLAGALWEADCRDIDVAALHQGFLAQARRGGAKLLTDARVTALTRQGERWRIETTVGEVTADIVVDAAGAWGDVIAAMAGAKPVGLMPLRRTVAVVEVAPEAPADLPLVIGADGSFYFKPDAGRLWASPHDEISCEPADVQPEEYDVALAIDRLETATTWQVKRLQRAWAGIRTFAPDRAPVYGYDPVVPGFFWCVGQGGFGIQTAPAAGKLAAALLLGDVPSTDATAYAPGRFS